MSDMGETTRKTLIDIIGSCYEVHPKALMSRATLAYLAADALGVTRQGIYRHMTAAVADGTLIEIRPRRDWLVELPESWNLPPLYAMISEGDEYWLQEDPPQSRGSSQVSFLITPHALERLLDVLHRHYGVQRSKPTDSGASYIYDELLRAIQNSMPEERPWKHDTAPGGDFVAALIWLDWLPDVIAHQTATQIRINARRERREPGGRRQTCDRIIKHADAVDPLVKKQGDCDLCAGTPNALSVHVHYHRKADGRIAPSEILRHVDRG